MSEMDWPRVHEAWTNRALAAEAEVERLRLNHKDAVETKRRTDARLKWALAGLQRIYNESSDSRMAEIAGEAFEKATSPLTPPERGSHD